MYFSRTDRLFQQVVKAAHVKVMRLNNKGKQIYKKKKTSWHAPVVQQTPAVCFNMCENENAVNTVAVMW